MKIQLLQATILILVSSCEKDTRPNLSSLTWIVSEQCICNSYLNLCNYFLGTSLVHYNLLTMFNLI